MTHEEILVATLNESYRVAQATIQVYSKSAVYSRPLDHFIYDINGHLYTKLENKVHWLFVFNFGHKGIARE